MSRSGLRCPPRFAVALLTGAAWWCGHSALRAQPGEPPAGSGSPPGIPQPVTDADVAALREASPFLRPLDLSKSVVLNGVARIDGKLYATLMERETRKTHIVSRSPGPQGWTLVGIEGSDADLEGVIARISVPGGEVFAVHYDESQLKPGEAKAGGGPGGTPGRPGAGSPASNYREGISGDGFRGPPPPEVVAKLSKLSDEQREGLIRRMGEIRSRHPEIPSETRRTIFVRMLDRALQERR